MPQPTSSPAFDEKQLQALEALGLSRTQAILYLTSLKHGVLSVLELSKLTKLNRQQIYEEAEQLIELDLYDITRKRRRRYIPAGPRKLIKVGQRKVTEAEGILAHVSAVLPSLEALQAPQKNQVLARYYEGIPKIKEAYENELEACKNIEALSFAGSIDDIFKFFPEAYWDRWNRTFVQYGSRARMLVHNSRAARETSQYDPEYNRETRYLENFPLKVNIDVFGNVTLIVSFYDELAIWIESPVVAQTYRIIFEALWTFAKPFL